jgi:hypothetical protein
MLEMFSNLCMPLDHRDFGGIPSLPIGYDSPEIRLPYLSMDLASMIGREFKRSFCNLLVQLPPEPLWYRGENRLASSVLPDRIPSRLPLLRRQAYEADLALILSLREHGLLEESVALALELINGYYAERGAAIRIPPLPEEPALRHALFGEIVGINADGWFAKAPKVCHYPICRLLFRYRERRYIPGIGPHVSGPDII